VRKSCEFPVVSIQQRVNLLTTTRNINVSYGMRCCYYFNSNSASNLVSKSLHFFSFFCENVTNHDDGNMSGTASSGTEGKLVGVF
jgi:hypothetical protein